jgi:amino acid adenylation domain-containing protein/non-ribosomal peptide synthase protein (TIGR01720 family)
MCGPVTKYVPFNLRLSEELKFNELVKQAGESVRELAEWQEYFSWEEMETGGDEDVPFFSACFDYEERERVYRAGALSFTVLGQYYCSEKFSLKLSCIREGDSLITEFYFDRSQFTRADVRRLAAQFHTLLKNASANPEATIGSLEAVGPEERRWLLSELNRTEAEFPRDRCFHELFEEQVELTPDSPAVADAARQLSYRELNEQANRVASLLRKRKVGPETLVGLFVGRSVEMIVGLLGIMKAGGAYLPLDPESPSARLSQQLASGRPRVLLTLEQHLKGLPEYDGEVICLDGACLSFDGEPSANLENLTTAQNLAYVIYTSGSTGTPKGVGITHRSLLNYTHAIRDKLRVGEASEVGLSFATVSTIGADLGNTAIYPALSSGGCLHVIDYEVATDSELFGQYMSRHRIDVLKIVPSHLNALLSSAGGKVLPRKYLFLGGEALSLDLLERISRAGSECQIFNHYGPTETTVGVLALRLKDWRFSEAGSSTVPLGRPLANTRAYILDANLSPVPTGAVGDLYIGGEGLARGYLSQPGQTAARFIPDPFGAGPGTRLYKTGDRARRLRDGNIEFRGRADGQVKVRGYRIELGEIETILRKHARVREAAVTVFEDAPGEKYLAAYIVAHEGAAPSVAELRAFLKEALPEYMLPSAFVTLDAMPLSRNGKLDRQALPRPERTRAADGEAVPPRTPVEGVLERIWADVLRLEKVGVFDNFFELSGDSISSIQIAARAGQAGLKFTPLELFRHPTIAELAEMLNPAAEHVADSNNSAIPLTPEQQRLLEGSPAAFQAGVRVLILQLPTDARPQLVETSIRHLLARHEALRLRFERDAETESWRQLRTTTDDDLSFTQIHIDASDDTSEALDAAVSALRTGFDALNGPLVRAGLMHAGDGLTSYLILLIHSLLADEYSLSLMSEELHAIVNQLRRGEPVQLPAPTASFAQWAARLSERGRASGAVSRFTAAHEQPANSPVSSAEGESSSAPATLARASLGTEETAALFGEVPEAFHIEVEEVLLTALARTLSRHARAGKHLIEVKRDGRNGIFADLDLSRTVGCFDYSFPLQLELEDSAQRGTDLKAVKERMRRAAREYLFAAESLVADAGVERNEAASARASVSFSYREQPAQDFSQDEELRLVRQPRSLEGIRRDGLEVAVVHAADELHVEFTLYSNLPYQLSVEDFARDYVSELRELIRYCRKADDAGYTPSDFRRVKLTQQQLEKILSRTAGA